MKNLLCDSPAPINKHLCNNHQEHKKKLNQRIKNDTKLYSIYLQIKYLQNGNKVLKMLMFILHKKQVT